MNFLAHAWLAAALDLGEQNDTALIAGGVVGDWIKGPLDRLGLPADLRRGVALHRAIDAFAETHPAFRASRARCAPERRRWAGVLVDMYYDHLLARDWAEWHPHSLSIFVATTYIAVARHASDCPPDARPAIDLMRQEDWLCSYATVDGLADVLARMGRRVRRPNPLADGMLDLLGQEADFANDFGIFIRDARGFVGQWKGRDIV